MLMYTQPASAITPALIIYLIDASNSMNDAEGTQRRIEMVQTALQAAFKDMVRRSMRDGIIQRRYKIALLAYNDRITDVLGGIRDLPDALQEGLPTIETGGITDMAAGFTVVEELLTAHLAEYEECPAPLICHLTDGLFTTKDPSPIVKRIAAMQVRDGAVLVENIYMAQDMLRVMPKHWQEWKGVQRPQDLNDDYARFLFHLSSPIPESYRQNLNSYNYQLQAGAVLFFPGAHSELMRLAFAISTATQMK